MTESKYEDSSFLNLESRVENFISGKRDERVQIYLPSDLDNASDDLIKLVSFVYGKLGNLTKVDEITTNNVPTSWGKRTSTRTIFKTETEGVKLARTTNKYEDGYVNSELIIFRGEF